MKRVVSNMSVVRTRVPLRISFGGGGTDVEPYASQSGGVTLNATIARYVYSSVTPRDGGEVLLESEDMHISSAFHIQSIPLFDGELDLIKAVLARISPNWRRGLAMRLQSDAPPGSGLGSSSALVVSSILSIARLLSVFMGARDVARLAYQIERKDLGILGGYQDQYAAAFGGFNWTEYTKDGVFVTPLGIEPDVLMELEYKSLLWYTGDTHVSSGILQEQINNYEAGGISMADRLHRLKLLASDMRDALLRRQMDDFGGLLDAGWQLKKQLAHSISSDRIDELYATACQSGAIGGKVLGAGGGGYLLFYVPERARMHVMEALSRVGGYYGGPLHFDLTGPRTWNSEKFALSSAAFVMESSI